MVDTKDARETYACLAEVVSGWKLNVIRSGKVKLRMLVFKKRCIINYVHHRGGAGENFKCGSQSLLTGKGGCQVRFITFMKGDVKNFIGF